MMLPQTPSRTVGVSISAHTESCEGPATLVSRAPLGLSTGLAYGADAKRPCQIL